MHNPRVCEAAKGEPRNGEGILYVYIYIYIVATTKEFSENKVLNIVRRRAITVKVTLTSARCDTVFHIRR